MASWDPSQYGLFAAERMRPALDLMARIPLASQRQIVDLGCGPGTVTMLLRRRFADATVTGVDNSEPMLAAARAAAPDCRFEMADLARWSAAAPVDLLYANASLQWLDDHALLFPHLLSQLAPGGTLAAQMPAMHDSPMRRAQSEIAGNGPWADHLRDVRKAGPILTAAQYWDLLRPRAATLDIWETTYIHALGGARGGGPDPIAEWAAGTSLRPFLDKLPPLQRAGFFRAYADAMRIAYTPRPDGTTLLPFRRLFLVATVP